MSRTGTIGRLFGHVAEPVVQMNGQDMARRQLKDGELVHVTSKRGSLVLPAQASAEIGLSQVFIAMHWGEEFLSGSTSVGERVAGINALTTSAFCPDSKQPELKHAAVKILKAELPWSLLAMGWLPTERALTAAQALRQLMPAFPFASCGPFSTGGALGSGDAERTGILFRAAAYETAPDAILKQIEDLLGISGADTLRYADARHGQRRAARLVRAGSDAHLDAFLLAGDTRAEAWIKTLLKEQLPAQAFGRQLLRPGTTAPADIATRGKIVCSCFGVTETAIADQLRGSSGDEKSRLAALQKALQCGTNCGSCVPELQRMVRTSAAGSLAAAP
jgi:assimilatory nitrate reductase catalytic subunit